ncbi:MAG: hypothetical protein K9I36_07505 [Bacteroidia bacterium]|nr:hypothetical protein [Bacteroidia bacterium]
MNIELEKTWLLEKIAGINSEKLISRLKAVIKEETDTVDFWDELHDDIKAEVKVALTEIQEGKYTPHEEVMKDYEKWLKK